MKSLWKVAAAILVASGFGIPSNEAKAGELRVRNVSCQCAAGSGASAAAALPSATYSEGYAVSEGYAADSPGWVDDGGAGAFPLDGPPALAGVAIGPGPQVAGPPPGTVGITYRRAARYIPEDEHPRTGMLTVEAPGATAMAVEGMKGYQDTDGYWQFKTIKPLLPGLPHIYHVKARVGAGPDAPVEFRTVRLIPGRIIDLNW